MDFKKYQHIVSLGDPACEGILNGDVYVFSKLDGCNVGIYLDSDDDIKVNSRNRVLSREDDHFGVCKYVLENDCFKKYFELHPNHRLFGEWLVPHTIKGYHDTAWNKLYIFDVMLENESGCSRYLDFDEYIGDVIDCGLNYIPCIRILFNPTIEKIKAMAEKCTYLMKNNLPGEGVVIKNYNYTNPYGRVVWAKYVLPKTFTNSSPEKQIECIEQQIITKFLTPELIQKEHNKFILEHSWSPELIPQFLGVMWNTFFSEEMFNAVKKFHEPTINFKTLHSLAVKQIKSVIRI